MEYETPKTRTQGLSLDRISTLPDNIIENILTLMPIRDALRTSILSKTWRYTWRSMPKLVFTDDMVEVQSNCERLRKSLIVNAIFHVFLLHNGPGPTKLEFDHSFHNIQMGSEFDQIISYISKGKNNVKKLTFTVRNSFYHLPVSFFSLQGLVIIELQNCVFEPPLACNGFRCLKKVIFRNVKFSAKLLQPFFSKCPVLEYVCLIGDRDSVDFAAGETNFTYVELLQCVPLIRFLQISKYYMKPLSAGGLPHELPALLVHLEYLFLDVCLRELNEISSILCLIRSSPWLEKIIITMCDDEKSPVQQTPTNFLDPEDYSDLNLEYLETLVIEMFSNLPLEMEFVKLIMAKSPALKKVRIELSGKVSADDEIMMLRDLVRRSVPRASPSADLIIERPTTSS